MSLLSNPRCNTEVQMDEVKFEWTISNFDFHEAKGVILKSSVFSAATNDKFKWCLVIKPNGETSTKDTVSLYLNLLPPIHIEEKLFVKFDFCVLDQQQNVIKTAASNVTDYSSTKRSWGWTEFLKKDQKFKNILSSRSNKLTFRCIIEFSEMKNSFRPINSVSLYPNALACDIVEDFKMLLENHKFSDIVLSVKNKEYRAHKAVLAVRSSVFAAMFEHNFKENESNRIEIEDLSQEVVAEMLRYIYTGKCENSEKLTDGLLAAADKYDLNRLKMISADALYQSLSVDNAMNILALADLHNVAELKSETIKFIVAGFSEVVVSTAWKNILVSRPELINEVCQAVAGRSTAPNGRINEDPSPECKRSRIG